jgi:hypothetical protein
MNSLAHARINSSNCTHPPVCCARGIYCFDNCSRAYQHQPLFAFECSNKRIQRHVVYFSTFSSVKHYLISEKGMRSNTDYCGVEILFQNFISAKRGLNRKIPIYYDESNGFKIMLNL